MDRAKLLQVIDSEADRVWYRLGEAYPELRYYKRPGIILNNRFTRTAGVCYQKSARIELAYKFFVYSKEYLQQMFKVILPHELAHQADYNLFGESEKRCGHGKRWKEMMLSLNLAPEKYHSMDIKR